MWSPQIIHYNESKNIDLHSLISGKVPAIILKEFYDKKYCDSLIQKIKEISYESFQNGKLQHIGPFLMSYATKKEQYFAQAKKSKFYFDYIFSKLDNPSNRIFETLKIAFPKAKISLAQEFENDFSPFIIRIHEKGESIPIHKDHVGYEGKEYSISKIDNQLSCILHIQESEMGGDLVIYKINWKKQDEKFRNIDFGYSPNVISSQKYCKISDIEKGDLVLINPLFYHEVTTIQGPTPRITLGMFLGFSKNNNEIISWA